MPLPWSLATYFLRSASSVQIIDFVAGDYNGRAQMIFERQDEAVFRHSGHDIRVEPAACCDSIPDRGVPTRL
jgi:hypothetical protein